MRAIPHRSNQSPFPYPMVHRAAPISVSIVQRHVSANAVKATARGWSTGSSASLTFPLHSRSRAPDEKAMSTSCKVFGMTQPGTNPRPTGCEADALPLGHHSSIPPRTHSQLSLGKTRHSSTCLFMLRRSWMNNSTRHCEGARVTLQSMVID